MTHNESRARWKRIADYIKAKPNRTCQNAMDKFDLSATSVRHACYMHDVPMPRLGKVTVKAMTLIARLQDETLTTRDIIAEFGLTKQAIHDAMKRARAAGIRFPSREHKKQEAI